MKKCNLLLAMSCLFVTFLNGQKLLKPLRAQDQIEQLIDGGENQSFVIDLEKNQFFHASIQVNSGDLVVTTIDPKGNVIESFDDNVPWGESVFILSKEAGEYQMVVSTYDQKASMGKYKLEVKRIEALESNPEGKLNQLFQEWDQGDQPGMAIAVVKNGRCTYQRAFGMSNLEYDISLSKSSIFDLASLAKQFTGMAIAMLLEQGRLHVQDEIRKYLPELPDFGHPITINHLLNHSSGLRDFGQLLSIGTFGSGLTKNHILEIVKYQEHLNFIPGSQYSYSNTGYVLLAAIVERITGTSFRQWIDEQIFQPLNMHQSFFNDNPFEIVRNRAVGYNGLPGQFRYLQENGMSIVGSSALFSNLEDMIKWLQNFDNPKVGGKTVIDRMFRSGTLDDGTFTYYGYGIELETYKGLRMLLHQGSSPAGFRTAMAWFPDQRLGLIVLSNWGEVSVMDAIVKVLADIYLKQYLEQNEVVNTETALVQSDLPEATQWNIEQLDQYIGQYSFKDDRRIVVSRKGSTLYVFPEGMEEIELQALSDTKFFVPPLSSTIEFVADENGVYNNAIIKEGEEIIANIARIWPDDQAEPINFEKLIGTYMSQELGVSYFISRKDGELMLTRPGQEFRLNFDSGRRFFCYPNLFTKVEFLLNEKQDVLGFLVSIGSGARDIKFEKWERAY